MAPGPEQDNEWLTRKRRIDPRLDVLGWRLSTAPAAPGPSRRTEEEETDHGPADYALWLDSRVAALVEAKKLTVGPQNVLMQAERYARGLRNSRDNFDGFRAPFIYSTNGEVIWFRDVRHPLNRSRRVADFHTPSALREMLDRDFDAASARLLATPNDGPRLRPYQRDANAAVEQAIAARKRHMLVAMATGTGKTFTLVNQIYRLMKSGSPGACSFSSIAVLSRRKPFGRSPRSRRSRDKNSTRSMRCTAGVSIARISPTTRSSTLRYCLRHT
jgi:type I restriction enzyme R subunit